MAPQQRSGRPRILLSSSRRHAPPAVSWVFHPHGSSGGEHPMHSDADRSDGVGSSTDDSTFTPGDASGATQLNQLLLRLPRDEFAILRRIWSASTPRPAR